MALKSRDASERLLDGVRRWFEVGPLLVHASALSLPVLLVFAASEQARHPFGAHAMLLSLQVVHCTARGAAFGLAAYFAGSLVAPCFGEFPVPLLGFGSSPLVGAFLGLAALRRVAGRAAEARPTETAPWRAADDKGFTSRCSRLHDTPWIRRSAPRHAPCPSPIH